MRRFASGKIKLLTKRKLLLPVQLKPITESRVMSCALSYTSLFEFVINNLVLPVRSSTSKIMFLFLLILLLKTKPIIEKGPLFPEILFIEMRFFNLWLTSRIFLKPLKRFLKYFIKSLTSRAFAKAGEKEETLTPPRPGLICVQGPAVAKISRFKPSFIFKF